MQLYCLQTWQHICTRIVCGMYLLCMPHVICCNWSKLLESRSLSVLREWVMPYRSKPTQLLLVWSPSQLMGLWLRGHTDLRSKVLKIGIVSYWITYIVPLKEIVQTKCTIRIKSNSDSIYTSERDTFHNQLRFSYSSQVVVQIFSLCSFILCVAIWLFT